MTFAADEASGQDYIELYRFTFGDSVWLFNDSDADYIVGTDIYPTEAISRGDFQQTDENTSMTVDVTIPALNPVADVFRKPYLPAKHVWLTIYGTHRGSVEPLAVRFRGTVGVCTFEGVSAKLSCVPLSRAVNRAVPIQLVQRLCTNTLYDQRCKVDPDTELPFDPLNPFKDLLPYKATRVISVLSGLDLFINIDTNPKPVGFFNGGFIVKEGVPPATIRAQIDETHFKLLYNPGYVQGDEITLYAGCDKRVPTCVTKFDNMAHHQGFPLIPAQDPFKDQIP